MQQLIDSMQQQNAQRDEQMYGFMQQMLRPQQDQTPEQIVPLPSPADWQKALEEGDTATFTKLQQQERLHHQQQMALMQKHNAQQLQEAENRAAEALNQMGAQILPGQVSDYDRYKAQIEAELDELGIQGAMRNNPRLIEKVKNSVIGANIEEEIKRRREEEARQANGDATNDMTNQPGRRNPVGAGGANSQPVFEQSVYDSMQYVGHDRERVARQMGYSSWAAYEAMVQQMNDPNTTIVTHSWLQPAQDQGV